MFSGHGLDLADALSAAVCHKGNGELRQREAEPICEGRQRGADGSVAAVLHLQRQADPIGARRADQTLRPTLRRPALVRAHQLGIGGSGPPDQVGVSPHRSGDARAVLEHGQAGEHVSHPLQGERERDHAAAVRSRRDLVGRDLGGIGYHFEARLLDRVLGKPIVPLRPVARDADGEHPRVLARAVVLEARRLGAALELVVGGRSLREQGPHRGELIWAGEVRRGGDRQVSFVQIVARVG